MPKSFLAFYHAKILSYLLYCTTGNLILTHLWSTKGKKSLSIYEKSMIYKSLQTFSQLYMIGFHLATFLYHPKDGQPAK